MASSTSSSSIQENFKHDVFLSFRGEDTRKNFVDHLYEAFKQRGIIIYRDDEEIKKGRKVKDELNRSIDDSRFHIIVFSKNYVSSSWCLDELVKIMECSNKTNEQTAYPIFYDVEPTEVRNQSGAVGLAFAKHEKCSGGNSIQHLYGLFSIVASCCNRSSSSSWSGSYSDDEEQSGADVEASAENVEKDDAGRWRDALKEAADLAGWELKTTVDGHQAKFIQKVVGCIYKELLPFNLSVDKKLVGMETRVKKVISSLEAGVDDVRMVGIKGIGGGGKTTLARVVFDHISTQFEGASFVENVREVAEPSFSGLNKLQTQVLKDMSLNVQIPDINSVSQGKEQLKRIMRSRKVLVVLDDVNDAEQLEALAGEPTWFKKGSRIIITTRDKHVLAAHGVNFTHDINLLTEDEAICLFSKYAFKKEFPNQGYEELSREVVHYAKGLPLTIKVLGSYLCGKIEHNVWKDTINKLKTIPEKKTLERLKLSYTGLPKDQQEIFLDVACILKGERKYKAIKILQSCGYHSEIGLKDLEDKSLINISNDDRLLLHDLVEEMGLDIVRHDHPTSRLWKKEQIEEILVDDLGTKAIRSIILHHTDLNPAKIMQGLRKMRELICLHLDDHYEYNEWEFNEVGGYLPNSLRYLCWPKYPFGCLPKTFQANNLINLKIVGSEISQLWEGGEKKVLNSLKFLKLGLSKLRTFDLGIAPNLEILDLKQCVHFVKLRMSHECLHLEELNLSGCRAFSELHVPVVCLKLKYLNLSNTALRNLNLGLIPNLEILDLKWCYDLVELNMPIELPRLKVLQLSSSKMHYLNLVMAPHLKVLDLHECSKMAELHMPIEGSELKFLNLSYSELRNLNLVTAPHLERLEITNCKEFVELHMPPIKCSKLKHLNLGNSKVISWNLEQTPNLETLILAGCKDFVDLYMPIECSKLKCLKLSGSKVSNLNLELTPSLETLDLEDCIEFAELYMPIECSKLKHLSLRRSKVSNFNLGLTPNLETLDLKDCKGFVELHIPVECPKLGYLNIKGSKVSNLNRELTPNLWNL